MEKAVNCKILRRVVVLGAAILSLTFLSANLAATVSRGNQDIYPNLAADGVTSDDVALAKAGWFYPPDTSS